MRLPANKDKIFVWLAYAAITLGIAIRIVVYLQNRNLMIDEANVARNIYERGFAQLLLPLSYEQYAPPLWLWAVKASSLLFGMGELALKLTPFISGIAAILLLFLVLKQLNLQKSAWYALMLFATGYIFIRYGTELKQYMTDTAIALALIWLALRTQIQSFKPIKLFSVWLLAGSIAIWFSMPSVFVLAGVGAYYFSLYWQQNSVKKSVPIILAALFWIIQFAAYYWFILREQANSEYLQNFHKDYFLSATPFSAKELDHNISLLSQLLGETAGFTFLAKTMHTLLILWASVFLLRKRLPVFVLLVIPLILLLVAAAANQYTLIPRVAIFMMPILLILIAYGLNKLMEYRNMYFKSLVITACVVCIVNVSALRFFVTPMHSEQLTDAMAICNMHNVQGDALYIHHGATPAYIYYTALHPKHKEWEKLKDARLLKWDSDYNSLAASAPYPCAFIFTSIAEDELAIRLASVKQHLTVSDSISSKGCHAYVFER